MSGFVQNPRLTSKSQEFSRSAGSCWPDIHMNSLLKRSKERELKILEAKRIHPALEDVFVRITGIASERLKE